MNNLYLTKPKTGETPEDEAFLLRHVLQAQGQGKKIHFVVVKNPMPEMKTGPRGYKFLCDYYIADQHATFSEGGDTRREALEAVLVKIAVMRLEVTNGG